MEDTKSVATLMESMTSKIQQLQKAFAELESQRARTLNLQWKQLAEYFHGLQKSLKRCFAELEDQEKVFEMKIVHSREILEQRQAAVIAKRQASLRRIQEKRDASVSTISIALVKYQEPCILDTEPDVSVETRPVTKDTRKRCLNCNVEGLSYPELVKLCQNMDSKGLHKFISDNRKNLAVLSDEIPLALGTSIDPSPLVLDSLNSFYNSDSLISDSRKDVNLLGVRRTCIMLLECLEMDSFSSIISENFKGHAKVIAEEWKPKLDELDADENNGKSLEAHAFLQLLSTFGINVDFKQEDLSKLIPMVSRRHQAVDLYCSFGLSDGIPGVIDVLIKMEGK